VKRIGHGAGQTTTSLTTTVANSISGLGNSVSGLTKHVARLVP
jgi:hypothetical protein